MSTVARITKKSELIPKDKINERMPVITNGLVAHYPLDNNLNISGFRSLSTAKVLGAYFNSGCYPTYIYIQNNCYSFTHCDNLTAITVETAKTYDLIVYDGVFWTTPPEVMLKIKEFVDAGISAIAIGNDASTNCFMIGAVSVQAAHNLVSCDNSFLDVSSLNGIPGSTDPVYRISSLIEPRSYPLCRRSDDNCISSFIYEGPAGGAFYFDHEGNPDDKSKYRFIYEYVLSKSVSRNTIINSFATPNGMVVKEATTNLLSFGNFNSTTGWTCEEGTIEILPFAGYAGGRNAVKVTKAYNGTSDGYFQIKTGFPDTVVAGTTYTASIKYKEGSGQIFNIGDWGGANGNVPAWPVIYDEYIGNGWRQRVCSITYTAAQAIGVAGFGVNSLLKDTTMTFCDFQLEKRTFATPFNIGTVASSYFTIPLTLSLPLSFNFKLKINNTVEYAPGHNCMVFCEYPYTGSFILWKRTNETTYRLRFTTDNSKDIILDNCIIPEKFHTICITVNTNLTSVYVDGILKGTTTLVSGFSNLLFGPNSNGPYGSNTISDASFYNRVLSITEIKQLAGEGLKVKSTGEVIGNAKERENLLSVGNNFFNTGSFSGVWSKYTQNNCFVIASASSRNNNKYCYHIYRTPNLIYSTAGNVMYGGISIILPDSAKKIGHTYKIAYSAKGQSSNANASYLSYNYTWYTNGVYFTTLQSTGAVTPTDFNSTNWTTVEGTYTVASTRWQRPMAYISTTAGSNVVTLTGYSAVVYDTVFGFFTVGSTLLANTSMPACSITSIDTTAKTMTLSVNATATASTVELYKNWYYDTYRYLYIGFFYTDTGTLGTNLFIDDINIYDVTDESYVPLRKKKDYYIVNNTREGMNKVFLLGAAMVAGNFTMLDERRLIINNIETVLPNTRSLCLSIWTTTSDKVDTGYDIYGDDTARNNLAAALLAIKDYQYWALTSRDACLTNSTLNTVMTSIGAVKFANYDWAVFPRSSYVAFGKGNKCWKEDLKGYYDDRYYATIEMNY